MGFERIKVRLATVSNLPKFSSWWRAEPSGRSPPAALGANHLRAIRAIRVRIGQWGHSRASIFQNFFLAAIQLRSNVLVKQLQCDATASLELDATSAHKQRHRKSPYGIAVLRISNILRVLARGKRRQSARKHA